MDLIRETSSGSNTRLALIIGRALLFAIRFMFVAAVVYMIALYMDPGTSKEGWGAQFGEIFVWGLLGIPMLRVAVEMIYYFTKRQTDKALLSVFTLVAIITVVSIRIYLKGA